MKTLFALAALSSVTFFFTGCAVEQPSRHRTGYYEQGPGYDRGPDVVVYGESRHRYDGPREGYYSDRNVNRTNVYERNVYRTNVRQNNVTRTNYTGGTPQRTNATVNRQRAASNVKMHVAAKNKKKDKHDDQQ
ncbi:MAG: hypothetical protein QOD99_2134 [Chthoniobacter sp.]|nr:hypothetical protein [Chthoniobacter sp.]